MPRLNITGEYPDNWKQVSDDAWATAGHRCIRCGHPYRKGEHGKGEWTQCGEFCNHAGPFRVEASPEAKILAFFEQNVAGLIKAGHKVEAQWRIGTVHHLDGNKSNCRWWNLLALCQRCHLQIQGKVDPQQPYMLEHSDWFKPYVAAFYAWKYEGRDLTRAEAESELERLLSLERIA